MIEVSNERANRPNSRKENEMLTIADLATTLDTDARTTRKFLRTITPREEQPGKGSRWAIEKKRVPALKKAFATYLADRTKGDDTDAA